MYNNKLEGATNLTEHRATTKRDLDNLEKYTNRTLIKFGKDKCRCHVQHLGCANPLQQYSLAQTRADDPHGQQNETSQLYKSSQYTLDYTRKSVAPIFCSLLLRAHLRYCVKFWAPQCEKDIDISVCPVEDLPAT